MIEASAPAKIILFGEHAVVYGCPAIAAPVSSLRAVATVAAEQNADGRFRLIAEDIGEDLALSMTDDVDNALAVAAYKTAEACGQPLPGITIRLRSDIPIASGLGSGAAVSTALVRALMLALGRTPHPETVSQIVYEVEKVFHGTPSGIDNTVIAHEKPIFFVRGSAIEPMVTAEPLTLLIADTGIRASTKVSVGDVRRLSQADPAAFEQQIAEIRAIVLEARTMIESGHLPEIGSLMLRNHDILRSLTVSSGELDTLVNAAMEAGAYGAKLSGGGRGGNMIALVPDDASGSIAAALQRAGAVRVFSTTVA
ncbi:mevalonate kinase [Anaerolineae bacterium CFX9]|nr:mevalonate kinase [Kamptonema cortianum]MDL1899297.1 mevalonate kinase [Anaerolineae bacterium CFX9]